LFVIGRDVMSGVVWRIFYDQRSNALWSWCKAGFTTWCRARHAGSTSLQVNIDAAGW